MIYRNNKNQQTRQSSNSNIQLTNKYSSNDQFSNYKIQIKQFQKKFLTDQSYNYTANPQVLEHLKVAAQISKQNKIIKSKFLKFKYQTQQKIEHLSSQNKTLKSAIKNYQQHIQKLFDTCQHLIINSKQKQSSVKRVPQKRIKSNNNHHEHKNQNLNYDNFIQTKEGIQNIQKIKERQKLNYITNGIKRLQLLLTTKYQQYMNQNQFYHNSNNKSNQTINLNQPQQIKLSLPQIGSKTYDIDDIMKLQKQNMQIKKQNTFLLQNYNSTNQFLKSLKIDYQRVYKELFLIKKQKESIKINSELNHKQINQKKLQFQQKIKLLQLSLNQQKCKNQEISKKYEQSTKNIDELKQQNIHILQELDNRKIKDDEHNKKLFEKQLKIKQLMIQLDESQNKFIQLQRQKQNHSQLTMSQNIQHLQQIRKYKLIQQKYNQLKTQCYQFQQQIQTLKVKLQRQKKQIAVKQASIDQKIQRIFNMQKQIQLYQQEKDKIHDAYTQITKFNSELNSKCTQLQQDKQNLQIQLNIKISQLNAIVDSQPVSNQTSKGNLPLESVIVFQSKIDFLEEELFKRIKNFHHIEKINLQKLTTSDLHYQCKTKQVDLIKFIQELQIYVKYLQREIGSKNQFFSSSYRLNNNSNFNENSNINKQPSIILNMNANSGTSLNDSQNPKHSPIIRLDEFQNTEQPNFIYVSSQNIILDGENNPILNFPQPKTRNGQEIKIEEDNADSQYKNEFQLSSYTNTKNIINPQNFIIQQKQNSSLSKFQYSPATTQKNIHKKQVSRYLFQNEDKGSKFSFNLFSQTNNNDQLSNPTLIKNHNELPQIRYYIPRNQNFDFLNSNHKHKNMQSDLTFYNRENFQGLTQQVNQQDIFKSEIKANHKQYQTYSPQKLYQTQIKAYQKDNKRSFLSAVKNRITKEE